MTAYRQQALAAPPAVGRAEARQGFARRDSGRRQDLCCTMSMAGSTRAERGIYVLTDAGHGALKRWPQQKLDLVAAE